MIQILQILIVQLMFDIPKFHNFRVADFEYCSMFILIY